MTIPQILALAIQHHQKGQFSQAESLYRQILARDRDHADALHLLGVLHSQTGDVKSGIRLIKKAIKKNKTSAVYYSNLGAALKEVGNYQEAAQACRHAIALNPKQVSAETYNNLGVALKEQDKSAEAMENYRRALAIQPNFAEVYSNMGEILKEQGDIEGAIEHYQKALAINPQFANAHNNLGVALRAQKKWDEAAASYQQALRLDPKHAKAYFNFSSLLFVRGFLTQAVTFCQQAIQVKPEFIKSYLLLSEILLYQGKLKESIEACQQALQVDKKCSEAYSIMGACYFRLGQWEAVRENYRHALNLNPKLHEAHSGLLMAMSYSPKYDAQAIYNEHLRFAKQHAAHLTAHIQPHQNDLDPQRRLKIGYLSPDYHDHPTVTFMEAIWQNHDRSQFELLAYANVVVGDKVTKRLQDYFEQWHDLVGKTDEEAATLIREHQVDILIDLTGHAANNRILVFARKPAPVQVAYLGYPATTGLATMDYKLTDSVIDPPGEEKYHTEQLFRLPTYRIVQLQAEESPAVNELPALQTGHITLASFNNFLKVSDEAIKLWAKILLALPSAQLKIVHRDGDNPATQAQIKNLFTPHGVDEQQLIVIGRKPFDEYLQLHNTVDLALDPFPHMGGTTTFLSLWMGVPVITLMGKISAARGASPQLALGLNQCVAITPEQYIENAVYFANHLTELNDLRINLREQMIRSPLMDAIGFTRTLEDAYRQMWQDWCQQQAGE